MKLYTEGIENFQPWSGAVSTWERIDKEGKLDELESHLDELYPDGLSETELNDLLWFEEEQIFEWLGITDDDSEEEDDD